MITPSYLDDVKFVCKVRFKLYILKYRKHTISVATHNVAANCEKAVRAKAMTCSCIADGDPVPTSFEWRSPSGTVLHSGSSYTTPPLEQSLDGSYYTCVASNDFSIASRNTSLFNLLGKYTNLLYYYSFRYVNYGTSVFKQLFLKKTFESKFQL